MQKLILWLIRKKLGIKKNQKFFLKNQADKQARYVINDKYISKVKNGKKIPSRISVNFILSDEIKDLIEVDE